MHRKRKEVEEVQKHLNGIGWKAFPLQAMIRFFFAGEQTDMMMHSDGRDKDVVNVQGLERQFKVFDLQYPLENI